MGERALVVFTNGEEVSPAVYLHWHGEVVPQLLELAAAVMAGDPNSGLRSTSTGMRCPGRLSTRAIRRSA